MPSLEDLRSNLDNVDKQLVTVLAERQRLVDRVSDLKSGDAAMPLHDADRERGLLESLRDSAEAEGLDGYFVTSLYRRILDHSVRYQAARQTQALAARRVVSYQGVDACYSHAGAMRFFGPLSGDTAYHGYPRFRDALAALGRGEADFCFLPIENSTTGSIQEAYDLLLENDVHVVGEEIHRVEHCLLTLGEVPVSRIRRIGSHPQAIMQCAGFLEGLREVRIEAEDDTAGSARRVAEAGDPGLAAIASEEAANHYGLNVAKRNIADRKDNFTRFVVLAREPIASDQRLPQKTALLLTIDHRRGALATVLSAVAEAKLNLLRLEPRPCPETPWQYRFFVDLEGGLADPKVAAAVEAIRAHATVRVLGSYASPTASDQARLQDLDKRPDEVRKPLAAPTLVISPSSKYKLASRASRSEDTVVEVGPVIVGGGDITIIGGPCAVESSDQIEACARAVREAGGSMLRGGCFKPRTSPYDFQGMGFEGLTMLRAAGVAHGLPVVTEVLHPSDAEAVSREADVLQIGARNMQNFELLKAVGRLRVPVLLKRGMMSSIDEWLAAAEYILAQGNPRVILCERGIRTFETATRNTLDLSAVPVVRERTHLPIIVDPSHAAGVRRWVPALSEAAIAAGAHGVIVEMHPDPDNACSDGPQSLTFEGFADLTARLRTAPRVSRAA
ncbi:hypothetical protein BH23BAC4_BH23BAC4_02500 [soil metagenome]